MKNRLLVIIVAGLILFGAAWWFMGRTQQAGLVKIGFVSTFSGPQAVIGQDMRDAVELALEHIKTDGAAAAYQVIYEDDTLKPDVGQQKTKKLVQADKVDFVAGFIWSNVLNASYKEAADAQTFLIIANAGSSMVAGEACSPFVFSTSWQNDQNAMAMGEHLNQKGVKRLYAIAPNYPAGRDAIEGLKRNFKGEIIAQDMTKWPDQLDFSAELSKVRAAKPDGVYVFFPGAHGVQFINQYVQAGLKDEIPLYTVFTIDALSLPLMKEAALGVPATHAWAVNLDNAANKRFVEDFKIKYGRTPSFYAAQSYDAVRMIDGAVRKVGGNLADKDALRAALKSVPYESVRGPYRYGDNHLPIQDFHLLEAKQDGDGFVQHAVTKLLDQHQDPYASLCKMP